MGIPRRRREGRGGGDGLGVSFGIWVWGVEEAMKAMAFCAVDGLVGGMDGKEGRDLWVHVNEAMQCDVSDSAVRECELSWVATLYAGRTH